MALTGKKHSKKASKNFNFYLYCIEIVKKENRIPDDGELKKSKQSWNYYIRALKDMNIIYMISNGVWKCRTENLKYAVKFGVKKNGANATNATDISQEFKRLHGVRFKVETPKFDYWMEVLPKYFDRIKLKYETIDRGKLKIMIEHDGHMHTVHFCKNRTITIIFSVGVSFIDKDAGLTKEMAKAYAIKIIKKISRLTKKDYKIRGDYDLEMTHSHVAMINNHIARRLREQGDRLMVYVDGQLRMITDNSFNLDELEGINNNHNVPDTTKMSKVIAEIIDKDHSFDRMDSKLNMMMDRMAKVINIVDQDQKQLHKIAEDVNGMKADTSSYVDKFK